MEKQNNIKIPFLDLKSINAKYRSEFLKVGQNVIDSGWYIRGERLHEFEGDFATFCRSNYCVGVGNGLDAITLVLLAYINLGRLNIGDEVLVPANTYIATIFAIINAGLKPVLVEPDPQTYNISINHCLELITNKTKACLVVHLYGQLTPRELIQILRDEHELIIIEDAAQAHGARFSNEKVAGNLGDAAAFSFYPAKNLGALGDGGAVVTSDNELEETVRMLANYGSRRKYLNEMIGVNSRLDELQAAFLSIKLNDLDSDNEKRRQIARIYESGINNDLIVKPFWSGKSDHVFHLYVIQTENRDKLQAHLKSKGIETLIHYPIAPHRQLALKKWENEMLPNTVGIHEHALSLPISQIMNHEQAEYVAEMINEYGH